MITGPTLISHLSRLGSRGSPESFLNSTIGREHQPAQIRSLSVRHAGNVFLEALHGGRRINSQAMNRERFVAQSCSRHINQMAMMRKDHNLPALGKLRQSTQHVRRAFII